MMVKEKAKNKARNLIFLVPVLLSGMQLAGQEILTLSDAIRIGLENNYSIIIQKNDAQIAGNNNTPGNAGLLYQERGRGMLAQTGEFVWIDTKGDKKIISHEADKEDLIRKNYYRPQEWNEYTIIARGNHIVQILNGFPTVEIIDEDPAGRSLEGILVSLRKIPSKGYLGIKIIEVYKLLSRLRAPEGFNKNFPV